MYFGVYLGRCIAPENKNIQGVSKKRGIKELNIKTMKGAFQEKH
jgi:hypothetical protein